MPLFKQSLSISPQILPILSTNGAEELPDIFYNGQHLPGHFFLVHSVPLSSFTLSRRTDGRKAAWHSFLIVQFSGRGASNWFMLPTLHGAATGLQQLFVAPGSMLPHRGGKNGRGSPTGDKSTGPRAWPSTDNHRPVPPPPLLAPRSSHLGSCCPLRLYRLLRSTKSEAIQPWSARGISPHPVAWAHSALAQKKKSTVFPKTTKQCTEEDALWQNGGRKRGKRQRGKEEEMLWRE